MKRLAYGIPILLGLVFPIRAQLSPQSLTLTAGPPSPIIIVSPTPTAPFGGGSYCWWVVANYPIGHSTPSNPGCTPNVQASAIINWNTVPGATSYDVLRTTTPILPNVTANIAVATSVAGPPLTDNFGVLSGYSILTAGAATALFLLDNQNQANPAVRLTLTTTAGYLNSFLIGSGGAGTPGGTPGQIQYNSSGAFGGFTASGDFTINTSTGVGTLKTANSVSGQCTNDGLHTCQITTDPQGRVTNQSSVAITAGTGNAAAIVTLAFSATPTFTCPSNSAGTVVDFQGTSNAPIVLTGNITSSTQASCTPGSVLNFLFKQDGTGGRTVAMPTGFDAPLVHPAPNATTKLSYYYDGVNVRLTSAFSDAGYSALSETSAPGANPPATVEYCWADSTRNTWTCRNSSGNNHIAPRTAGSTDQLASGDLSDTANIVTKTGGNAHDFPDAKEIPAANCNNGTAGPGWSIPTSSAPTVACRAGANNLLGVLQYPASTSAQTWFHIPKDWDTGVNPYVSIDFTQGTNTTASQTIIMQIQIACGTTDDTAFNTAQSFATATTVGTAHTEFDETVQLNSTSMTNCAAGSWMNVKILRSGSDTATTNPNVYGITITTPRLLNVQAD